MYIQDVLVWIQSVLFYFRREHFRLNDTMTCCCCAATLLSVQKNVEFSVA